MYCLLIVQVVKGVVQNIGHRTSFPSELVCYLSLETVFNPFHSVLLVAEIACARLYVSSRDSCKGCLHYQPLIIM